jgi:hypothetical protein
LFHGRAILTHGAGRPLAAVVGGSWLVAGGFVCFVFCSSEYPYLGAYEYPHILALNGNFSCFGALVAVL